MQLIFFQMNNLFCAQIDFLQIHDKSKIAIYLGEEESKF